MEAVAQITFEVIATQLPSTPSIEVPLAEVSIDLIEVIITEAPSKEKVKEDSSSAPPAAPVVEDS